MEKLLKIGRESVPFKSAYAVFDASEQDVTLFDNLSKAAAVREKKQQCLGCKFFLYDGPRDCLR